MKLGLRQIFTLVPAILFSIIMPAQDLPKMPEDPAIVKGVLPNGLSYFIASNGTEKGIADFSLIQKTGMGNTSDPESSGDHVRNIARETLTSIYRLRNATPQDFFLRHGSHPGGKGFVSVSNDATIFRFPDVDLSSSKTVLDSALLVIMDMTDRSSFVEDDFLKRWYSPADQAVVIAGDVDAKAVVSRLEGMAYMIPGAVSHERVDIYSPDFSDMSVSSAGDEVQTISMSWASTRVPGEYMNTVQPVIFDMALNVLGKVAVRRIKRTFESEDIPAAGVSYSLKRSDEGPGDDMFTLNLAVRTEDLVKARQLVTAVMESIDIYGASVEEYLTAESDFMTSLKRDTDIPFYSNAHYVEKCISAFLYNSYLSSDRQVYSFHNHRELPDSVRCGFFNDVASALIYPLCSHEEKLSFNDSITTISPLDALVTSSKVKVRSTKKDHLSGGLVWTFSNGFKVVYRNMPSNGDIYYTLALNGGYSSIAGLGEGEGAFVSDIFRLCRIAGLKGDDFFDGLLKEKVIMKPRVTMSNTLIEGRLPKERLSMLMQALLAVANGRSSMEEAFHYYRRNEDLALEYDRNSFDARMTAIDSIMCPGYRYSPYKSKGGLTSSFYSKAYSFLDSQMGKMNDGVLVIVGDIDEESLKQQLLLYVGGFNTNDASARKTVVRYQPVSGWSTYTVKGQQETVDVAFSARMPLTSTNYLSANIAVMLLERNLAYNLGKAGISFDIMFNCRIYPEERINVLISVRKADVEGFAVGIKDKTAIEVLGNVRDALSGLASKNITDDDLKRYKAYLKNRLSLEMKDPMYWVDAITIRYLDGKDLTTGYAAKIDALTKEDISRVLMLLDRGCKVEYVTEQ